MTDGDGFFFFFWKENKSLCWKNSRLYQNRHWPWFHINLLFIKSRHLKCSVFSKSQFSYLYGRDKNIDILLSFVTSNEIIKKYFVKSEQYTSWLSVFLKLIPFSCVLWLLITASPHLPRALWSSVRNVKPRLFPSRVEQLKARSLW